MFGNRLELYHCLPAKVICGVGRGLRIPGLYSLWRVVVSFEKNEERAKAQSFVVFQTYCGI